MKQETDTDRDQSYSIDSDISKYWCRVIENIATNIIENIINSMQTEQFFEVEITGVNIDNNTVICRNIQTGEVLSDVPNYSNFNLKDLLQTNADGGTYMPPFNGARGRLYISNINDNPYYLGLWYN